jgi:hypothetical protein
MRTSVKGPESRVEEDERNRPTACRASALRALSTPSSRSKTTASAPDEIADEKRSSRVPGTKSRDRSGRGKI